MGIYVSLDQNAFFAPVVQEAPFAFLRCPAKELEPDCDVS